MAYGYERGFIIEKVALPKHRYVREKDCYLKTEKGYCANTSCGNCGSRCLGWAKCSAWTTYEGYARRKRTEKEAKRAV